MAAAGATLITASAKSSDGGVTFAWVERIYGWDAGKLVLRDTRRGTTTGPPDESDAVTDHLTGFDCGSIHLYL